MPTVVNIQVSKLENRVSIKNYLKFKSNYVKIMYFYLCDSLGFIL